jgi:hypothetical protein
MTPTRTLAAGLIPVIAMLGTLGAAAPTAHADAAADNTFTAALSSKGINFASPQSAIVAGHEVCDQKQQPGRLSRRVLRRSSRTHVLPAARLLDSDLYTSR